jgi:hypothetical protein
VLDLNCPHCGKEVPNQDAIFCSFCSKPLQMTKRSGLLIGSGVLTILSSALLLPFAIYFIVGLPYYGGTSVLLTAAGFAIIGFTIGLVAGILTLTRKLFPLAIIGLCIVFTSSIISSVFSVAFGNFFYFLIMGLPSFIMLLLSLIFTAVSKRRFG